MTVSGRLAGLNRAGQDQSRVPPITRVARSSARACRALTTRPSNPCPQLDSVLDDHGGNSAAGDRHVPMEPVMQLRHLRWARSAQLLNAVRSTPGITRTAAARSLGMGSGTATGLIERMRGGHLPRRYQAAGDRLPRSAHTQKGPWFLRSRSHAASGGWPWQVWMAHLRWLRRPDRGSAWLGPGADRGRIRSCGGRPVEVDPPVRGPGQDRQASVALVRRGTSSSC